MQEREFHGSCLCGAVKYEIRGEPVRFYHCHCSRCRKASGTGHASNLMIRLGTLTFLSGEELVRRYKVPEAERFTNVFCSVCGGRLPRVVADLGAIVLPAGSLDHEPGLKPHARIYWDSRTQWSCEAGELPVYAETQPASEWKIPSQD